MGSKHSGASEEFKDMPWLEGFVLTAYTFIKDLFNELFTVFDCSNYLIKHFVAYHFCQLFTK